MKIEPFHTPIFLLASPTVCPSLKGTSASRSLLMRSARAWLRERVLGLSKALKISEHGVTIVAVVDMGNPG